MSLALFTDIEAQPRPLPELEAFALWINSEDGKRFWQRFDNFCLIHRSEERLLTWATIYKVTSLCGVQVPHDFAPLIPRLWMIYRKQPEVFARKSLSRYTELEVTATCMEIIAGWLIGGEA